MPACTTSAAEALAGVRELARREMEAVDALIREQLRSNVALIDQLGAYIINNGGKRLRPLLMVLSAGACGYRGQSHKELAAVIEFIHTATLLHDDVVDESELRRSRKTANALFGNAASVLVGDFLYSRSFQMMVRVGDMRVMEILADTTNTIAEGEVMQLLNVHDPDTTEERYLRVIHCKTAKLFEAAARLGAVIAKRPPEWERGLALYGMHLGTAFQLIDDALDYTASADELGKNVGDDLAEGKPTLPLLHVLREGSSEQAGIVRKAIENGGLEQIEAIMAAVESTGAIEYTARLARSEADQAIAALQPLPETEHKRALQSLADFAVDRTY